MVLIYFLNSRLWDMESDGALIAYREEYSKKEFKLKVATTIYSVCPKVVSRLALQCASVLYYHVFEY